MSLVIDADGHVEENLGRARRRHPGGHAAPRNARHTRTSFTGLFESMARRDLRRDPTILD
jgi:hypothetical protein